MIFTKTRYININVTDGSFVTIAMGNEVMVWQPASNFFVKCPKTHYQQVTVVRFTKDGSLFVTAGEDGMVIVWNLSKVLSTCDQTNKNSALVFSDHQLPITDVNITQELYATYLISTSMDRTCRIYDLNSKTSILKIVFESIISVGIFGDTKNCAFLGDTTGNIFKLNLSTMKSHSNEVFEIQLKDLQKFSLVHKREVTSLVTTANNMRVVSGGLDKLIVIWSTDGQALKVLLQNSEITNITLSFSTCLQFDKEYSLDNSIKNLCRVKCDIKNNYLEIYTSKQKLAKNYLIGKSTKPSKKSTYKLEVENMSLKINNAKIFEHCKMLINLN